MPAPLRAGQARRHVSDPRPAAFRLRQTGVENIARTEAAQDHLRLVRPADAGARYQGTDEGRLPARTRHAVRHVPADRALRSRRGVGYLTAMSENQMCLPAKLCSVARISPPNSL